MIGWLANLLQVMGLILLGERRAAGWLFGIAAELLWLIRAGDKDMPDLQFISIIYICLAISNIVKWGK